MRSCCIMRIWSRKCRNVVFVQINTNRISSVFLCLLYPQYTVHVIIHDHTNHTILLHLLCSLSVEFLHPPKNIFDRLLLKLGLGGWDQGDHLQPASTRMTCKTRLHMPEVPHNFATRKFTTKWTSSLLPKWLGEVFTCFRTPTFRLPIWRGPLFVGGDLIEETKEPVGWF